MEERIHIWPSEKPRPQVGEQVDCGGDGLWWVRKMTVKYSKGHAPLIILTLVKEKLEEAS
jgi:hypothetical protein